jgi:hypothetical protein
MQSSRSILVITLAVIILLSGAIWFRSHQLSKLTAPSLQLVSQQNQIDKKYLTVRTIQSTSSGYLITVGMADNSDLDKTPTWTIQTDKSGRSPTIRN